MSFFPVAGKGIESDKAPPAGQALPVWVKPNIGTKSPTFDRVGLYLVLVATTYLISTSQSPTNQAASEAKSRIIATGGRKGKGVGI